MDNKALSTTSKSRHSIIAFSTGLILIGGALLIGQQYGYRKGLLMLVGGGFGIALYHASFGFTSAWRVFIADRRGSGLRVQMLLLAMTVLLFFPALADGTLFDRRVGGFVVPAGTSIIVGAFIFGIGMQLAGGCASGTLFTVGGGNSRMVIVLLGFIAGSVIATAHAHWWSSLPKLPPISLVKTFGLWPALALNLTIFALIAALTWYLECRRHGGVGTPSDPQAMPIYERLLRGPWPLIWGAIALALLSYATLALAGRPWGITSAFALWGAKIAMALGIDVTAWPYWAGGRRQSLDNSVFRNTTSVMNFGILLGAFLAANLARKFAPVWNISSARQLLSAILGGLMLGYGARLAAGCNIGAYLSGIASGSLHGWFWLVAGFAGSIVGTWLRPLAGLNVERSVPPQPTTETR